MSYPVYYPVAGDTLPIFFDTFDGGTGASITMSGLAVTDIEIYKDGSTTQRASDAGYTLLDTDGIDIDGITGIHGFSIDLSDNTDSGFYAVGSWYHVIISAITVDSQAVSFVAAAFRIVSATRGLAGTALPDAAADAAGGLPISDAGGLDLDTQIGTDIDAILTDTADMRPKLGTISDLGSGATVAANLADIEAQTDDIGAAGAGLTAVPWNAAWDAEVQSEVTDGLNAYDPPTRAELTTDINSILSKLLKYVQLLARSDAAIETDNATELTAINADGGSGAGDYSAQADSLEAGQAEHDATQTAITGLNDPTAAAIRAEMDSNSTQLAAIVADTNELQTDDIPGLIAALNNLSTSDIEGIVIETGYTLKQTLQLIASATAGKLSGAATTTNTFRNLQDDANRITATVDSDGNRTAVTHNV